MKIIKLTFILAISVSLASCIKRIPKKENANTSESVTQPRVITDTTIIKEIIIKQEVEPVGDIVQQQQMEQQEVEQPKTPAQTSSYSSSTKQVVEREEEISNNSGFFDQYQRNYKGDPNSNLKPTTRVVDDGADEIQRKKEAIEKSLNQIDLMNKQQKQEYERAEKERQAANEIAIQKAKELQKNQKNKQQQPKGKTLDTDLLLK